MMVSEETARRIADELKRLNDALERTRMTFAPPPRTPFDPFDLNQCRVCGGNHNGLPCPHLSPTAAGLRQEAV